MKSTSSDSSTIGNRAQHRPAGPTGREAWPVLRQVEAQALVSVAALGQPLFDATQHRGGVAVRCRHIVDRGKRHVPGRPQVPVQRQCAGCGQRRLFKQPLQRIGQGVGVGEQHQLMALLRRGLLQERDEQRPARIRRGCYG